MSPLTRRRFFTTAGAVAAGGTLLLARQAGDKPADPLGTSAQAAVDRGLAYLARAQLDDGGFPDGQFGAGNVAVTALAGLALMAGGNQPGRGLYGRTVSRAVDYVIRRQSPIGLLSSTEAAVSHAAMYQHGFGTLFLAEAYGMMPDSARNSRVREALDAAVSLILSSQQRGEVAGWRHDTRPNDADVSVTVAMMMAASCGTECGAGRSQSGHRCRRALRQRLPDTRWRFRLQNGAAVHGVRVCPQCRGRRGVVFRRDLRRP
ncbi:MAG: hypothetical protein U0798_07930 [Gemmataceae bacterium]